MVIAILGIVVALLVGLPGVFEFIIKHFLSDYTKRQKSAERFNKGIHMHVRYQKRLADLLQKLDKHIGKNWSRDAFYWSYSIAFLYPIGFALIAWLFSNKAFFLGEIVLLPPAALTTRCSTLGGLFIIFLMWFNLLRIIGFLEQQRVQKPQRYRYLQLLLFSSSTFALSLSLNYAGIAMGLSYLIAFALWIVIWLVLRLVIKDNVTGAGAVAVAVAVAVTVTVAFVFAVAVAVAGAVAFAGAVAVAGAFAGAFAGTVAILAWLIGDSSDMLVSASILFFHLLLPLVNSIWDYVSLSVSRKLSLEITEVASARRVALHLLRDIAFACIALFGLIATLVIASKVFNLIYGFTVVDWRTFANDATTDPWGVGFFVNAMLLSTLIPTMLHVFIALAALIVPHYSWSAWLVARLERKDFETSGVPVLKEMGLLVISWFFPVLVSVGLLVLLYYLVLVWSPFHIGAWLYAWAEWVSQLF